MKSSTGNMMMSVAVQVSPFSAAKPVELFDVNYDRGGAVAGYDVAPDGQHFLMTVPERTNPTEIPVVVGWPEELKRKSSASPAPVNFEITFQVALRRRIDFRYNFLQPAVSFSAHRFPLYSFKVGADVTSG